MISCPICESANDLNENFALFTWCDNKTCQYNLFADESYVFKYKFANADYRIIASKKSNTITLYHFENFYKLKVKYNYYFKPPTSKEEVENLIKKLLLLCALS